MYFPLIVMTFFSFVCHYALYACDYRKATADDVQNIVKLLDAHTLEDAKKIVLLPIAFRQKALLESITKGRIFVACDQKTNDLVAYKKLFIVDNQDECREILEEEMRMQGASAQKVLDAKIIFDQNKVRIDQTDQPDAGMFFKRIYIYNGADFTHPQHRNRGINNNLTSHCLEIIAPAVTQLIKDQHYAAIAMLYGLSMYNAGNIPGDAVDRTPSIARVFQNFLKKTCNREIIQLHHERYKAVMPTFDPHATVCKPLPDDQGVPGFGCLLVYNITQGTN